MVRPTAVPPHLRRLAASIGSDTDLLQRSLTGLVAGLRGTATSYHGLRLTLVDRGCPVTLTEFADPGVVSASSLRVDLALIVVDADPASRIVFYAGTPGAFVDLAADLQYALKVTIAPRRTAPSRFDEDDDGMSMLELDGDLPSVSTVSGLTGLVEFSTINRAVGLLIGRGYLVDAAHEVLREGAAAAGMAVHVFAAGLVRC